MKKFILIKNVNGRGVGNVGVIDGNESVNVVKDIQKINIYIYYVNVYIKWFINGFYIMDMFMFWKLIVIVYIVQELGGMIYKNVNINYICC